MENSRIFLALKALRELGLRQVWFYAWYQLLLRSGYLRWWTADGRRKTEDRKPPTADHRSPTADGRRKTEDTGRWSLVVRRLLALPPREKLLQILGDDGLAQLLAEANEIVDGRVRLFGGVSVPLVLSVTGKLYHWTTYETGKSPIPNSRSTNLPIYQFTNLPVSQLQIPDIKFIWEPARFGWAFTLGRSYHLSGDERYPEAFWRYFEIFQQANPPNLGPNWTSAQEVALRLIAFTFAAQIFAPSNHSTAIRHSQLAISIADHAARIPPTLVYARSQNNNHLLSEAAGLITAALALPDHPAAPRWEKLGWRWFNWGLEHQLTEDGTYVQHSTNYHRLMLQLALWVYASQRVDESASQRVSESVSQRISESLTPNPLTPNPLTPNP
ncbi:MAG: heparinase II/III family protein, partial [Chloroflexota bacterium]